MFILFYSLLFYLICCFCFKKFKIFQQQKHQHQIFNNKIFHFEQKKSKFDWTFWKKYYFLYWVTDVFLGIRSGEAVKVSLNSTNGNRKYFCQNKERIFQEFCAIGQTHINKNEMNKFLIGISKSNRKFIFFLLLKMFLFT